MIPFGLKIGERIELLTTVDLHPHAVVYAGSKGTVAHVDGNELSGTATIRLDDVHCGLTDCDNCMWLHSPYCDDVRLRRISKERRYMPPMKSWLAAACVAAGAIGIWEIGEGSLVATATHVRALDYQRLEVVNDGSVKSGGTLMVRTTTRRNLPCYWQFLGSWENMTTLTVLAKEKHDATVLPVTVEFETHVFSLRVPNALPPGPYAYKSVGLGDCDGDGLPDTSVVAPTIYFTITE